MIKIDIDTRCWQIPKEECFLGVESDDKVKILQFELSKNEFCNGLNFTDCNCFINYKNEGNDTIPYAITDMEVKEDGTVTFTWKVSRGATIFKGNTFAVLCAKKISYDGTITNEWNSRIGTFTVSKGLEPLSSIAEVPEIDIISQLLLVAQQTNANAKTNIDKSSQLLEKAEGLDAELIDGRIGYDGTVYDNLGVAIRKQVSKLKGDIEQLKQSGGTSEESDPTVSDWAKQPTKPKYTASEVGALPDTTKIPSKTSDLQNDSGFLTESQVNNLIDAKLTGVETLLGGGF